MIRDNEDGIDDVHEVVIDFIFGQAGRKEVTMTLSASNWFTNEIQQMM